MSGSLPDVLVVGGGIVGCSTALFLARRGATVTIVEKDRVGSGATNAAAGILSPPDFLDPDVPVESGNSHAVLARRGYDFYPRLVDLLAQYDQEPIRYETPGTYDLAFSESEFEERRDYCREMRKYDRNVEWVEREELLRRHAFLSEEVRGGFWDREDARIYPEELMQALVTALDEESVTRFEGEQVTELTVEDGRVKGVKTTRGTRSAGRVLLAAGCWTAAFESDIGQPLPVEPRKGEMIRTNWGEEAGPVFRHGERWVMRREGDALIGSTVRDTGFENEVSLGGVRDLLGAAIRIVPGLGEAPMVESWSALRPYAARRGGPFLGVVPGRKDLYIAAGHYKTGILQGPYTGYLMAQLLTGDEPELNLEAYSLER